MLLNKKNCCNVILCKEKPKNKGRRKENPIKVIERK